MRRRGTDTGHEREMLSLLQQDIPEGSGFSPGVIHDIMGSAMVVPRLDACTQTMIMAESAVQENAGGAAIGEGCVIWTGSVVTKDIPAHSLAVGNPCRVIRQITDDNRMEISGG